MITLPGSSDGGSNNMDNNRGSDADVDCNINDNDYNEIVK